MNDTDTEVEVPPKKSHKGLIIAIIIVVLILVIAGGGVGLYFILKKKKKPLPKPGPPIPNAFDNTYYLQSKLTTSATYIDTWYIIADTGVGCIPAYITLNNGGGWLISSVCGTTATSWTKQPSISFCPSASTLVYIGSGTVADFAGTIVPTFQFRYNGALYDCKAVGGSAEKACGTPGPGIFEPDYHFQITNPDGTITNGRAVYAYLRPGCNGAATYITLNKDGGFLTRLQCDNDAAKWSLSPTVDLCGYDPSSPVSYRNKKLYNASGKEIEYAEYFFNARIHSFRVVPGKIDGPLCG